MIARLMLVAAFALGVAGCTTLAPRNFNPRDECDGCAPGLLGGEDRAIEVL